HPRSTLKGATVALWPWALVLALLTAPASAFAEAPAPITRQALGANAAWLPYAPPPPQKDAICLVDTGVTPNPDTANLVYATSVDPGTSEDVAPNHHATLMTMLASSPGPSATQGVMGFWPRLPVVSVRSAPAPPPGAEGDIPISDFVPGVERCLTIGAAFNVVAINMSFGEVPEAGGESAGKRQTMLNLVTEAHDYNMSLVAASGNESEAQVNWPAQAPGVMAVGGDNAVTGERCHESNTGPQIALLAPGCQLDAADPQTLDPFCCSHGTSQATVFVSTALAALRSYDPGLTWLEAQSALETTTEHGNLDLAAAFGKVGLGAIVAAGEAAEPRTSSQPTVETRSSTPPASPSATSPARAHRTAGHRPLAPRVRYATYVHGWLTLRLSRLPHHARLRILLRFAHRHSRIIWMGTGRLHLRTRRPARIVLLTIVQGRASRPTLVLHLKG
ncbi:MAG: S8 family peptidase, partial [Solirubrobacteraceae bacterium]